MGPEDLDFYSLVDFDPERGAIHFCGRRAILLQTDAMGALRKELVATLGADAAQVILTRYGFSCGYEDAGLLPARMQPESLEDFVLGGPRMHMFSGIAGVEPQFLEVDRERRLYRMSGMWRHSYEAEQHLRLFGRTDQPVCWTLAGYASGFASYVFQTDMICIETACEGRGDAQCHWRLLNLDDSAPELEPLRSYFQPLNIKDQINLLESKVCERTRELEASEQRYRDLIEDLPEMVFALQASGRVVHLNKAGRTRLGITADQVPGLRLKDLVLPGYRAEATDFLKQIYRKRTATKLDVVMRDSAGGEFPVQLQVEAVLKDGKIVGYSGLAVDIAARQERERTLSEYATRLEQRDQQLQGILSDGVYILDPNGRISFLNARMAELLGVEATHAVGRTCGELMDGAAAARLEQDFRRRLEGGANVPFEITVRREDATPCLLEISTAVLSAKGQVEGVIGVARDITARREMERQLAQATRLSALGEFASGIAHEINNPLGLVSGFAEELHCLLQTIPDADGLAEVAALRRGLVTIQEQAQRCKSITDNLLLFSRRQTAPLEVMDLAPFLGQCLDGYREIGLTRGLQLEVSLDPDLPPVLASHALLDQVLQNLVKNARDAMEGQGRLWLRAGRSATGVDLEVADEGPGLPPGVMDQVFDPFFTTKAPGRGTGLGLSICYGIMSELRGSITCGNRPQGGAWFRLGLRLADDGVGTRP
ncbi:MAG: PAS domain S-box protein [Rhodocyclaceae bacterium]